MLRETIYHKPFNSGEWHGYQPIYGIIDPVFLKSWVFYGMLMLKINFQIIHPKLLNISIMCGMVAAETYISWDIR